MIVERNVPEEDLQRAVNCGNSLSHCHQLLAGPLIIQLPVQRCISCCHALVMDLPQDRVIGVFIQKDSNTPVQLLCSLHSDLHREKRQFTHTFLKQSFLRGFLTLLCTRLSYCLGQVLYPAISRLLLSMLTYYMFSTQELEIFTVGSLLFETESSYTIFILNCMISVPE